MFSISECDIPEFSLLTVFYAATMFRTLKKDEIISFIRMPQSSLRLLSLSPRHRRLQKLNLTLKMEIFTNLLLPTLIQMTISLYFVAGSMLLEVAVARVV